MLPDDFQQKLQEHYLASLPGILEELEFNALKLEKEHEQKEIYFAVYRQIHSLKGSGGTYGFPVISTICHQFEDYLSEFETDRQVDKDTTDHILRYVDLLKITGEKIQAGNQDFEDTEEKLKVLKSAVTPERLIGLVVDNSKGNAKMIAQGLSSPHISITLSYDGIEALQRLLHEHFDFLITSKEIPTLNGPALIAATRLGSKTNKHIKIALLTSDSLFRKTEEYQIDEIVIKDRNFMDTLATFVNRLNKH